MNKKAVVITAGALGAVGAVTVFLLNRSQASHNAPQKTIYVHMPDDLRQKETRGMSLGQVVNLYGTTEKKRS